MIYLLYGSDTEKSRHKLRELVDSLRTKKPDASYIKITNENFPETSLDELIGGQGLFEHKLIVEMDMLFKNKEHKASILEWLKEIGESDNIFVFLEGELNKADITKFTKYSQKVQEFESHEKPEKKDFSLFPLADALGRKDKKQLWVLYTRALAQDAAPEEIHGILFWQIKALLQASSSQDAKQAGLHPFVYQKSLNYSKKFAPDELTHLSSYLISVYHNARRGKGEFSTLLEKFILEM